MYIIYSRFILLNTISKQKNSSKETNSMILIFMSQTKVTKECAPKRVTTVDCEKGIV